jgi:hypothetical protein
MTRALWLFSALLPLAAQPKLLINAQVDTRAVSAGLDQELRRLVAAASQPAGQPAWIGYSVPASRTARLGCEYVRDSFSSPGVIHLEPPEQAVILFRAEGSVVGQIRALSADCEIDAGGVQVHWLTGVKPAESIALLATFAVDADRAGFGAVSAIAAHSDRAALDTLVKLGHDDRNPRLQRQAISALVNVSDGVPALIQFVKNPPDAAVRKQAMNSLQQSRDPRALQFFEDLLKH